MGICSNDGSFSISLVSYNISDVCVCVTVYAFFVGLALPYKKKIKRFNISYFRFYINLLHQTSGKFISIIPTNRMLAHISKHTRQIAQKSSE